MAGNKLPVEPHHAKEYYDKMGAILVNNGASEISNSKSDGEVGSDCISYSCMHEFPNGAASLDVSYYKFANGTSIELDLLLMGSKKLYAPKGRLRMDITNFLFDQEFRQRACEIKESVC